MGAFSTNPDVKRRRARAEDSRAHQARVLHLITSFDMGGTERQAAELLKRLDRKRFAVRLAVLRREGPLYPEVAAHFDEVPEFRLNSFYDTNAVRQLLRLRLLMKWERIQILHAHDFYAGVLGGAAARLAGVRVLACQRHLRLSDRRLHEWGTRLIHKMAHRILVNSEAVRDHILQSGKVPADKVTVIRNGLITAEAVPANAGVELMRQSRRSALCRELMLKEDTKLVGIVARLQEVKGHRYFIEAAARVARVMPDVHFVLVGDGALRRKIEEQVKQLGLAARVHLLGERADAAQLAAAFDVAALTSLHEGLPNTVIEAMGAGTPVVATAAGGTIELIVDGQTGYLVPPKNAEALADRLVFVLSQPDESAAVRLRGQRFIQSQFGMPRMVAAVERLYGELMEKSA